MMVLKRYKIQSYEIGLYFRNGEFKGLLGEGRHWFLDPLLNVRVEVVSQREPWLVHDKLDMIVKSGALEDRAVSRFIGFSPGGTRATIVAILHGSVGTEQGVSYLDIG